MQVFMDPGITIGRVFLWAASLVLQAEMMVILRCTELLLSKNITRRRIHICFDSRAAIAALAKTTTVSALLWENMQVLEKLCGSNKVTIVQVAGHHRIQGNEEADKLTKEGTNGVPSDKIVGIPFVVGKEVIREHLNR
jgi:ribonuclease HI